MFAKPMILSLDMIINIAKLPNYPRLKLNIYVGFVLYIKALDDLPSQHYL